MDNTQLDFDKAYWLSEPPEVRDLQSLDPDPRSARASELAIKGFTVDVPIMVWGWDPYLVMKLRQDFGYTWVPSAMQQPVQVAPGLTFAGQSTYDPNSPPPGSIAV